MAPAPIALFVYRRLDHTRRTVQALAANDGAAESDLIIYSDGAREATAEADVLAVRQFLKTVRGFRSIRVVERGENLGLAQSIIGGVTDVLLEHEHVIVLEDDLVASPHFLRFMNDGLAFYHDDDRVASIHGYVYPVSHALPETFFLLGADCWGWATWRRGWRLFNPNGPDLLSELRERNLTGQFDFDRTAHYTQMLAEQIAGTNDSWAIRWYASAFLRGKLTLYPGQSLVCNIGMDASGEHSGTTCDYDVIPSPSPVRVGDAPVEDSPVGRKAFVEFFQRSNRRVGPRAVLGRLLRSAARWR